jgi:hypothetical protein
MFLLASISGPAQNVMIVVVKVRRERPGLRRVQLLPGKPAWLSVQDGKGGTSSESEARLRFHLGSTRRNAAKGGTTGYARAFRRAFDWQQRCRLR